MHHKVAISLREMSQILLISAERDGYFPELSRTWHLSTARDGYFPKALSANERAMGDDLVAGLQTRSLLLCQRMQQPAPRGCPFDFAW